MAVSPTGYLEEIKRKIQQWSLTGLFEISRERIAAGEGYIRLRIEMTNGHSLELAEYVIVRGDEIEIVNYKYHWQDSLGRLIKRWDNAPHHPEVEGAPHHLHNGYEKNVVAGESDINTETILQLISRYVDEEEVS
jgi:hypothetical protein